MMTRLFAWGFFLSVLAGCGFHLRGEANLPFATLYIVAADNSPFGNELKRAIAGTSRTRIVNQQADAQAVLQILSEIREKQILSLSGGGRVREFQLRYRVVFRLHDGKDKEWIPANEIVLKRDFSFNDTQVLAKEAEEAMLYRDMQSDAVQQMVRRLTAARVGT